MTITEYYQSKHLITILFWFIAVIIMSSCAAKYPFYNTDWSSGKAFSNDEIKHELYFIGDIRLDDDQKNWHTLYQYFDRALQPDQLDQTLVYLGNTIDFNAIPEEDTEAYQEFRDKIEERYDQINPKGTKAYFIPGNLEWDEGGHSSLESIQTSKDFLDDISNDKINFKPKNGCGEPESIIIDKNIVLVLNDSQWLMQGTEKGERKKSSCDIDDNAEYITYVKDVIGSHKQKHIILAAHHPVFSNGPTAGNYPLKDHLIPTPIIGSLVTAVRKIAGGEQKFGHPAYEAYRATMEAALLNCEGCIAVSAHDKSLQYHKKEGNHFVVSGSPMQTEYTRKGNGSEFAAMRQGLTKMVLTNDNDLWMEMIELQDNGQSTVLYRTLISPSKKQIPELKDKKDIRSAYGDSVEVVASAWYGKQKFLRGKFYRDAWAAPVKVPVMWLDDVRGGLKPVQQGGGFQTKSLRLENEKGQQWVLRSINKDVEKVVPPALRGTFAQDLIQDGIAAAHPYGAFVIPVMAEAAGIYHANPIAVYLPPQEALGKYNEGFADRLYLFEERPGGNTSLYPDYGYAEDNLNTIDLLEKLDSNPKHKVDQKAVWRARLFDIFIGDWDRHDDQWRWVEFDEGDDKIYKPVPRDRDQAFFKNDGFLDYLASRPFINPGLRKFDKTVDFYPGLIFNARHFDRSFMHELPREDVLQIAEELQSRLSDEVIDRAFSVWPSNIYEFDGEEIKAKLKARRAQLKSFAEFHYDYINKELTVPGTEDQDIFNVRIEKDGWVTVTVYNKREESDRITFNKNIDPQITKELRLFGLKKDDNFNFKGEAETPIKIRVIGGSGDDVVVNETSNTKILVYDKPDGMTLEGESVKARIKDQKGINKFDRKDWEQNRSIHFPMLSFYTDEGVGLSYNVLWKTFGFRKKPFQSSQSLSLAYFAGNNAIVGKYSGLFPQINHNWDLGIDFEFKGPTFTQFYYGLGNGIIDYGERYPEIDNSDSPIFHVVRGVHFDLNTTFTTAVTRSSKFLINPSVEYIDISNNDDDNRFYLLEDNVISQQELGPKTYGALGVEWRVTRIDHPLIPSRGFEWSFVADYKIKLSDPDINNLNVATNLQTYIPFSQNHTVVLAMNMGAASLFGKYEFYHANYLSRPDRLRAYKTNRFAGETMVYHATDLRVLISKGKGEVPISFGVFGAFDYGRVWYENDLDTNADSWHSSFGGGIFLTPLDQIGFKIAYYLGDIDSQFSIGGSLRF